LPLKQEHNVLEDFVKPQFHKNHKFRYLLHFPKFKFHKPILSCQEQQAQVLVQLVLVERQ
jgi:hypothetical protein